MKHKFIKFLIVLVVPISFFSSCNDNEAPPAPVVPNEEEVITTLNYTLISENEGDTVTLSFQDLDGDGGNAPTITSGVLTQNTTYNCSIKLLNEMESPAKDITEEVKEEDEEHQFFFASTLSGVSIEYADQDADGNPLGLSSIIKTEGAESGNITVTLRHEPDKKATGVSGGDITNAGGETDIEVSFDILIK